MDIDCALCENYCTLNLTYGDSPATVAVGLPCAEDGIRTPTEGYWSGFFGDPSKLLQLGPVPQCPGDVFNGGSPVMNPYNKSVSLLLHF